MSRVSNLSDDLLLLFVGCIIVSFVGKVYICRKILWIKERSLWKNLEDTKLREESDGVRTEKV